jgi:hypothetical protein
MLDNLPLSVEEVVQRFSTLIDGNCGPLNDRHKTYALTALRCAERMRVLLTSHQPRAISRIELRTMALGIAGGAELLIRDNGGRLTAEQLAYVRRIRTLAASIRSGVDTYS